MQQRSRSSRRRSPPPGGTPSPGGTGSAGGSGPTANTVVADLPSQLRGWYPRWWLLSAIGSYIFVLLVIGLRYGACAVVQSDQGICRSDNPTSWQQQAMIVGAIWLLFLLGWLFSYAFGFGPLEVVKQGDSLTRFLRSMTQFTPIYSLLLTYAGISLISIIVFWRLNYFQPVAYALACIVIFVAISCLLHRTPPENRRSIIGGCIFLSVIGAVVMFYLGPTQPIILGTECLIVLVGGWMFFRPRRQSTATASTNPAQAFAASQVQGISPQGVFMSLLKGLGPRQPTP